MPRKGPVSRRESLPDKKYGDTLVAKFINCMMPSGRKSTAEGSLYGAFRIIEERTKDDPLKLFRKAVENVKPLLEVRARRVGGATYQVPVQVRPERRTSLAVRWLIQYARGRTERSMTERLANEIIEASNNKGGAIKKREDIHKMAEANRAFAHYRW